MGTRKKRKYRVVFFNCPPPNFSTKKKIVKQPIMAFLSRRIFWNSSCGWLIGSFLFVVESRSWRDRNLKFGPNCDLEVYNLEEEKNLEGLWGTIYKRHPVN